MFRTLVALLAALPLLGLAAPVAEERAANACTDVIVIFARGTTEPGTIGTIVGPPLQSALQSALGSKSLTFTGVPYAADIPGFLVGGDPTGSATMAQLLTSAASSCPNAKLVTSGYSQGGQLVHNSAKLISSSVAARISAAVIFGDPDNGQAVQGIPSSKVDVICHVGDNICQGGAIILPAHLTYGADTPAAASFIAARV
ncbi:Cutinase [Mycena indigotica]|uniref:Cutinase n=1 Tax=Mycena indigotica TaxID=2126181 RepID=A0A8H6VYR1_9AGAR|nr:Cutinase [Mycena indigotica]KAF7298727.1 Cutinase [Mycena indigotica]